MDNLTDIWREVIAWPPDQRRKLATRLLQSLLQEEKSVAISMERQEALRHLIGIWKTDQPPNDDQVKQILDRERMKKYG
jgi:hypothetical protein